MSTIVRTARSRPTTTGKAGRENGPLRRSNRSASARYAATMIPTRSMARRYRPRTSAANRKTLGSGGVAANALLRPARRRLGQRVARQRRMPVRASDGQCAPKMPGLPDQRREPRLRGPVLRTPPQHSRLARTPNSTAIGPPCLVRIASVVSNSLTSGAPGHQHAIATATQVATSWPSCPWLADSARRRSGDLSRVASSRQAEVDCLRRRALEGSRRETPGRHPTCSEKQDRFLPSDPLPR